MWVYISENSSLNSKNQLLVRKIEKGTVIDHIPQGMGLSIYEMLRKRMNLDPKKTRSVILTSTESKKHGKKDIIKIEDVYPTKDEIDLISILAPASTIAMIKDWKVVGKGRAKTPDLVPAGILKCPNESCITYEGCEPVKSKFVVNKSNGTHSLQCWYCGRILEGSILRYLE